MIHCWWLDNVNVNLWTDGRKSVSDCSLIYEAPSDVCISSSPMASCSWGVCVGSDWISRCSEEWSQRLTNNTNSDACSMLLIFLFSLCWAERETKQPRPQLSTRDKVSFSDMLSVFFVVVKLYSFFSANVNQSCSSSRADVSTKFYIHRETELLFGLLLKSLSVFQTLTAGGLFQ